LLCRDWLAAAALAALAGRAGAQIYSCKDAQGNPHRGDFPPAECVGEICVTKPNGDRKCEAPPETDAQRQTRLAQEEREAECQKKRLDRVRDDVAFAQRYDTENKIEDERDRSIAEQQRLIDEARRLLEGTKTRHAALAEEALFHTKGPMPEDLRLDIEANDALLQRQQHDLAAALDDMGKLNDRYDAMVKRRQHLIQSGSQPSRCD